MLVTKQQADEDLEAKLGALGYIVPSTCSKDATTSLRPLNHVDPVSCCLSNLEYKSNMFCALAMQSIADQCGLISVTTCNF